MAVLRAKMHGKYNRHNKKMKIDHIYYCLALSNHLFFELNDVGKQEMMLFFLKN